MGEAPPTFLIDILSTVASKNLLSIKIRAPSIKIILPTDEFVAALDRTLTLPPFRNLGSFSLENYEPQSLLRAEIRARMPQASARGILE